MHKKLLFAAALLAALLLASCGGKDGKDDVGTKGGGGTGSSTASDAASLPDDNAPTAPPLTSATVSVAFPDESTLSQFNSYDAYAEEGTEQPVDLLFTTDTEVTDFLFVKLTMGETAGSDDLLYTAETLYTCGTLAPGCPLMVSTAFIGDLPERGISYTDIDGATKYFGLALSGEDGAPILIPITV